MTGDLDADALSEIVGHPAAVNGGVAKMTIARNGHAHGRAIGGSMGLTTWAAFSGSDERAAIDGDFIMTSKEVQPVLRALREAAVGLGSQSSPLYYYRELQNLRDPVHFEMKNRFD